MKNKDKKHKYLRERFLITLVEKVQKVHICSTIQVQCFISGFVFIREIGSFRPNQHPVTKPIDLYKPNFKEGR